MSHMMIRDPIERAFIKNDGLLLLQASAVYVKLVFGLTYLPNSTQCYKL